MEVLTYVPTNVILSVSGYQVKGWTEISIARNSPGFKQIRGIRGGNTRTRIKDTSATVTIAVLQTELLNEVFSAAHQLDLSQGTGRLELQLMEATGSSFFSSSTAYILDYPTLTYTSEVGERVWTLACDESSIQVGSAKSAAIGILQNAVGRLKEFVSDVL